MSREFVEGGPHAPDALASDEAEPTEAEIAEAARLREALEGEGDPFADALRASHRPKDLAEADLEALLGRALGDENAPPTRLETERAEALRRQLDGAPPTGDEVAELARALQAAHRPREIDPARHEPIVAKALADAVKVAPVVSLASRRRVVQVVATVASGFVALAAGVALLFTTRSKVLDASSYAPALIAAHSTVDLFDKSAPFPATGGVSARVDRIASARAADLRANRFAAWGVR